MHAENEEDIGETWRSPHHLVPSSATAAKAVRSPIANAEIGFGLDNTASQGHGLPFKDEDLAQGVLGHDFGGTRVKRARQGRKGRFLRHGQPTMARPTASASFCRPGAPFALFAPPSAALASDVRGNYA